MLAAWGGALALTVAVNAGTTGRRALSMPMPQGGGALSILAPQGGGRCQCPHHGEVYRRQRWRHGEGGTRDRR